LSGRTNGLRNWQEAEPPLGAVAGVVTPWPQVLVVQQQSGGVGIDLTRARIAIYYSLGYSLADYMQSRARLHRPGQTRNVLYMHLIVAGTVDELVYQALSNRADVVASVVEGMNVH
jgi:SNF2 family DNA or RNA helicase